ncbi:sigma factor-like helix-turn-helix DNA-binding protein [Paludisphaera mucosa]|uniref:Sigma factor-like helix-turn-helix DNA-binding protein n=1 Tax=Paludisphaera mucosa TaxID=3030827 RepID=A0ABT6FGB7_9BACT|nr:sigma factor-like helix-turn-helix DNA-binding protein [Paludisphaera mucosa]MDG3006621.1 sigma factor-like helix-turn-helix DNA-binding protein [Paludisphaera mucosa]
MRQERTIRSCVRKSKAELDDRIVGRFMAGADIADIAGREYCRSAFVRKTLTNAGVLSGLSRLPDLWREVIASRYGVEGRAQGLDALSRRLGIATEEIRRIEADALARLREVMG